MLQYTIFNLHRFHLTHSEITSQLGAKGLLIHHHACQLNLLTTSYILCEITPLLDGEIVL